MRGDIPGRRGWPLLSLGLLLGGWVLLRVAIWETPFAPVTTPLIATAGGDAGEHFTAGSPLAPARTVTMPAAFPYRHPVEPLRAPVAEPLQRPDFDVSLQQDRAGRTTAARGGLLGAQRIIAHSMLLAAGYKSAGALQFQQGVGPVAPGVVYAPEAVREFTPSNRARRWSMDMWALWRDDTTTPITSGRPSYGRSQVGAVLRYRLDPASGHAPQLHLRATRALDGASETDVALGVSARPLPSIPVRLAAEARVSETYAGTELRSAAYAVTELPPVHLPAGLTGEAYVQGGYVTGDFDTPFVDGQARITRELAGTEDFRLTAGGGAWGGAQENAERLDIGPSAGMTFRIGRARGRVSADYRFRVAGNAEPSSGPALTLTAGF